MVQTRLTKWKFTIPTKEATMESLN